MNTIIERMVRFWWVYPVVLVLCLFIIACEYLFCTSPLLTNVCFYIVVLAFLSQIVCIVVLVFCKGHNEIPERRNKLLYLVIICLPLCVFATFFMFVVILFTGGMYDRFGQRHPIPEGVEYLIPLDGKIEEAKIDNQSQNDIVLYNGSQGGMYDYRVYLHEKLCGKIWIECYEVGKNERLSRNSIEKQTMLSVRPVDANILLPKKHFTIYEGVWGEYYVARIELWFMDSITHKSRKLIEKTYRVEGWER